MRFWLGKDISGQGVFLHFSLTALVKTFFQNQSTAVPVGFPVPVTRQCGVLSKFLAVSRAPSVKMKL